MSDHYAVLQVSHDADETEIKRAWARLVRQHPPDQDPEGNRRLNEAKATLLDPRARADYDAQLNYGDEISDLFADAHGAMEDEDYDSAARIYKEILAFHPGSLDARNQLALVYAYDERYGDAEKQFQRLIQDAPDSALYAANLGHTYRAWSDEEPDKAILAEQWFRKATELESFNSSHHIALARLYARQKRYKEAEQAIEDAIGADGKIDTDDIDTMLELTWIFLFSDQKHRIASVAERIRSVLPDDPEAYSYAAFLFLRTAVDLVRDHNAYQDAEIFVSAAKMISTDFSDAEETAQAILDGARIDREADMMRNNQSIQPIVMPNLLAAIAHKRLGFELPDDYMATLIEGAGTWTKVELRAAASMCRSLYPNAYRSVEDVVEQTIELGRMPIQRSGCMVIPMVAVAIMVVGLFLL